MIKKIKKIRKRPRHPTGPFYCDLKWLDGDMSEQKKARLFTEGREFSLGSRSHQS